jgi:opacity protein-like surface antigen
MKNFATLASLSLLAATAAAAGAAPSPDAPSAASAQAPTIRIAKRGSQASQKGPAEYFTGSVRVDPLFQANEPSRTSGAYVTFEPGAREQLDANQGRRLDGEGQRRAVRHGPLRNVMVVIGAAVVSRAIAPK